MCIMLAETISAFPRTGSEWIATVLPQTMCAARPWDSSGLRNHNKESRCPAKKHERWRRRITCGEPEPCSQAQPARAGGAQQPTIESPLCGLILCTSSAPRPADQQRGFAFPPELRRPTGPPGPSTSRENTATERGGWRRRGGWVCRATGKSHWYTKQPS